jgi:predicted DNA-binding transcriptional regulator YafY
MSRTTGRTMQLLDLLQTGREWSGAELCARLGVSERTLRRDVDDLRGLGYGIDAVRGVGGGYRLGAGAAIPPLVLSPDEAVAIAVGMRAAAVGAVTGLEDAAAGALAKLEQSLSNETRERISVVEQAMVPLGGGGAARIDVDVVVTIARAIRESRRLRIDYTRHDGTEVRRAIEPHRILHTAERWYLVAWDVDRDAWRTLRVDRLIPRLPLAERFRPRVIPDEELRRFVSESIAVRPWRHRAVLRVAAPADEVRRHFGPTVARVDTLDDGSCRLETGAESWAELALYAGTAGFEFEVLEGDGLRDELRTVSARLARAAG